MATAIPTPSTPVRLTAPLLPAAVAALSRLELAFAPVAVANFDCYGSLWGFDSVEQAEADIAVGRAAGVMVEEWRVTDRDGNPLRVVRVADPYFVDTILVFSAWNPCAEVVR